MSKKPKDNDESEDKPKGKFPVLVVGPGTMGKSLVRGGIAVLAIFVIAVVALYILRNAPIDVSKETQDQPIPTIRPTSALIGNDLQRFMDAHGPWLSATDSEALRTIAGVRNLALFRSNGLVYSVMSVEFKQDSPWIKYTPPPAILGINLEEFAVKIQTQRSTTYTLNVTQPFMLDGDLSRIYAVDAGRQLWSARIVDLNFIGADQLINPEIPANPELSLSFGS
ncbi:MAG: hypothetical protein AAB531_04025 [Patescibacteria group bacterium]